MAKKEKTYNTTTAEMVEGKPMTREAFKNLTLEVMDNWVRENHPEIKAEWISIVTKPQKIAALFPDKKKPVKAYNEDGTPKMREMKKKGGEVVLVQETVQVPYGPEEERVLTTFEVRDWLCAKYHMSAEAQPKKAKARESIGNW